MALSFAFDGNDQSSFEQMKRKQKIAEALYAQASRGASNVGEGLTALGAAIGGRMAEGRANKLESAGRDAANASFGQLFGGAPSSPDSAMATPSALSGEIKPIKFEGKDQFVQSLMPAAIEASKMTGVDPRIIIAQGALESAWGKKAPGNNFFGIKSHGKGGGQTFMTTEVINGKPVKVRDSFRAYESPSDSVRGYAEFLLANPRYKPMMAAKGMEAQIAELGRSGYATDPNYSRKILQIASSLPDPSQFMAQADGDPMAMLPQSHAPNTQQAMAAMMQGVERARAPEGILTDTQAREQGLVRPATPEQMAAIQQTTRDLQSRPQNPVSQALMSRVQQRVAPQAPQGQPWERGEMIDPVTGEYMQGTWNGQRGQGNPLVSAIMGRIQGRQAPQSAPQQPAQAFSAPQGGIAPQQAQTAPQQAPAAQQGQPSQQQLIAAMGNPFLTDAQRAMAKMMFERQYMQDPMQQQMSQLELQKRQLELEQMRNPQPKLTDDMREYNFAREQGYEGSFTDFMTEQRRAGATSVNVATGSNSSKFVEESDKAAAGRLNDIVIAGQKASQTMADMQTFLDLGQQIGTGKGAQVKALLGPYAKVVGIDISGLDEIQAYEALSARLAPQMRPVGSGSSSDRDVSLFMQSLPNLRNTPEGNQIIGNTLKAVAQHNMNAAEIARKAQRGEISWQDADAQISGLPNPYQIFLEYQQGSQQQPAQQGQVPQAGAVEDGFRFKGGDPADPNNWERVQ